MKFVTYNIQYCKGRDDEVDPGRIAREVSGADIVALQEVERFWPRTGMVDQVAELSRLLPEYFWVYGAGVDMHIDGSAPEDSQRRQFGNMLLSKTPILHSRHHLLPKRGSIGPLSIQRSAIEATVQCEQHLVRLYSIHLTHLSSETRSPQIARLLQVHQYAVHEGAPISGDLSGFDWQDGVNDQRVPVEAIMMGDFNCQPDSAEYTAMVGPVSDYGGHISSPDGFVDAWTAAGHARKDGQTTDVNDVPATLDYCFVSSSLKDRVTAARVDTDATGSDHRPVWVDIDLS